jgi:hypothetical protein
VDGDLIGYRYSEGERGINMGIKRTALDSMDLRLKELIDELPNKERELCAIQPRGGPTISLALNDYAHRLVDLSNRCAGQRKWLIEKATFSRIGARHWTSESQRRLASTYCSCRS